MKFFVLSVVLVYQYTRRMEINEENLNGLKTYLHQTFNPAAEIRQNAEKFLVSIEKQAGFPILVLKLIEQSVQPQDLSIRQAAAVLFKNYVKKHWDPVSICAASCMMTVFLML